MIVRLMGDGQYEVDEKHLDEINEIDNNLVILVERGDEKKFKVEFRRLTDTVHKYGKRLPVDLLKPSDVIIPPADLTFEEAKKIFMGKGIIRD